VGSSEIRWGIPYIGPTNPTGLQAACGGPTPHRSPSPPARQRLPRGSLDHFNWEINEGSAASGATLDVTFDFTAARRARVQGDLLDRDQRDSGIGTPDIITIGATPSGGQFAFGGYLYTLSLLGFSLDNGQTFTTSSRRARHRTTRPISMRGHGAAGARAGLAHAVRTRSVTFASRLRRRS